MRTPSLISTSCLLVIILVATVARAQESLMMTCAQHGNSMMTLKFVREPGQSRNVEVIGQASTARWTVTIDGQAATPPTQILNSPGEVPVHVGDTITFKVQNSRHGILFLSEELARGFLDFDEAAGKPLDERAPKGEFDWGTDKFNGPNNTLAVATVREVSTPVDGGDNLLSLIHMPSAMVVPSCSGGNFLIGMDTASRSKLVGIPLFDVDSASTKTVTAMGNLQWKEKSEVVEVGKEIQWLNGAGPHGLRIKNWDAIKGAIDVVEVGVGSKDSFIANGRNSQSSSVGGAVFARLLVKSIPSGTDTIEYNCIIHGEPMNGTVKIVAAPDMPNDEDILQQLESDWAAAVATNDPDKISEFFTDKFLFVGASGVLQSRTQHLEDFESGKLKITSVTLSEMTVQIYHDNNAAIVSSTVAVVGEFDGRDITGNYQFTDTLIKIDGRWLAASRQQTPKR